MLIAVSAFGVLVAGIVWSFIWFPRLEKKPRDAGLAGAQIFAALVTSVGIASAGLLYFMERQWSPRFTVDVKTATYLLDKESTPKTAVVHVVVSITNQGRTEQRVNDIEVAAVLPANVNGMNRYGDVPGRKVFGFVSNRPKQIGAGETDLGFFEVPVSCAWHLIRVVVKVPQPPFDASTPIGKRQVYERKVLVPLSDACS